MKTRFVLACCIFSSLNLLQAQGRQGPGRSIGSITTQGDLIVMELNEGAPGKANLFDLAGRTLRFTPDGPGYRAENTSLQWDAEFGPAITNPQVTLSNFAFPYSGKTWNSFSVGTTGSIAFAPAQEGNRGGGVSVDRFAQLQEAARTLVNTVPAICVFFKPRMSGSRYFKELPDRAVITWSVTEPAGGIQDFTWTPTINRFQAVLRKDGTIELSYQQLAAKDAIVGIFPLVNAGTEKELASVHLGEDSDIAAQRDIKNLKLSVVDGLFLKVTFETRGALLPEGDAALAGITYHIRFDHPATTAIASSADFGAFWTIRGAPSRRGGGPRYSASGPGVSPSVKIEGNKLSIKGMLPPGFKSGDNILVNADVGTPGNMTGYARPESVMLDGIQSAELDLSTVKKQDGPFTIAYESFHYLSLPNHRDLTCTVIQALGDKFDFLAYYSDFRIDNQEAGTPSNGPLGGGPNGGAVTGIGAMQRGLENYCTKGRFQWQFIQPVYIGSNQMHEQPPPGTVDNNTRNIAAYSHQLAWRRPDGLMPPYNYAISQIAHEMGHRWSAFVSAKVNGETIPLGPTHWARGLHAPVPFPYQRPIEASAMGGGYWQDNLDGTFTQLDDDYYVPATGWSYLDLYLMGLAAPSEVPDFYILRNLVPAGQDANSRGIFKAGRTKVTVQDVIAAEGPRMPDIDHSQRQFNTGMVVIVEHGKKPSKELIERTNGIKGRWVDYWETTTGHRSSMTAMPK